MDRHRISTENAPAALGPYSQAIVANGFVFCSGTVGIDPQTGELLRGGGRADRTGIFELGRHFGGCRILTRSPSKDNDLLRQCRGFRHVNEVYGRHMPDPPPARSAPANVALTPRSPDFDRGDCNYGTQDLTPLTRSRSRVRAAASLPIPKRRMWVCGWFARFTCLCFREQEPRCRIACPTGSRLERTPDLEPDRADLDGEHPVALVHDDDATVKCFFGLPGGAQDRD